MAESKSSVQIPEQVKEMVEKAIEQAEQGVYSLIEAADKSASIVPNPTKDFAKKLLSMGAQNMNAAFDHARNLLRCSDLQEAANLQAQFLNAQFETASRQLKELYGTPGSDVEPSSNGRGKSGEFVRVAFCVMTCSYPLGAVRPAQAQSGSMHGYRRFYRELHASVRGT